jgi:hypothetical protein
LLLEIRGSSVGLVGAFSCHDSWPGIIITHEGVNANLL